MPERNQLTRARMQGGLSELNSSQTTRNRDLFLRMRSRIVLAMKAIYINVMTRSARRSDSQGVGENTRALYGELFLQGNRAGKQNTPGACASRGATGVYENIITRAQSFATPVSIRRSHPRCITQLRLIGAVATLREDRCRGRRAGCPSVHVEHRPLVNRSTGRFRALRSRSAIRFTNDSAISSVRVGMTSHASASSMRSGIRCRVQNNPSSTKGNRSIRHA